MARNEMVVQLSKDFIDFEKRIIKLIRKAKNAEKKITALIDKTDRLVNKLPTNN